MEEMGCKAHTYCVAYLPDEFEEIMRYSSHLVFNSVAQYERFRPQVEAFGEKISCGIRCNPEYSEVETELYNPAAPGSRLGEVDAAFANGLPAGIEGLHFHTLCESTSYDLEKTLAAFEQHFGHLLPQVKWVNMGGGHLMTKKGYDTAHLVSVLKQFKEKWGVDVLLEPGSAIAWETGVLVSTVLDIHESRGIRTAITDISFTGHMPDTLEMPYRPRITHVPQRGEVVPTTDPPPEGGQGEWLYRIGGVSCLSGDYMREYAFRQELQVGDRLVFEDMIHYTMVKTTTFNGVRHPDICILRENGNLETVKQFGYEDYRNRLS
ncbi:MAG: carboxynorspermidine decarboxylase [Saprospiraceae bacterium]|nr:carboxynorspermidine decarboxylase [Saprospiraceae bacterium]